MCAVIRHDVKVPYAIFLYRKVLVTKLRTKQFLYLQVSSFLVLFDFLQRQHVPYVAIVISYERAVKVAESVSSYYTSRD
jgi:hypothetical protein